MPPKTKNLLAGLTNAKTRTFVILFGAIVIGGVAIAFMNKKNEGSDVLSKQGSQATTVPTKIKATPGGIVTPQYKELQIAENERRAQLASKAQTSAIPTIMGATSEANFDKPEKMQDINSKAKALDQTTNPRVQFGETTEGDFLGTTGPFAKSAVERERDKQETRVKQERERLDKIREDKERALQRQQAEERAMRMAEQEQKSYQEQITRIAGQMRAYSSKAYDEWSKFPRQQYVQGALASKPYQSNGPEIISKSGQVIASPKDWSASNDKGKVKKPNPKMVIKAGTVLFGVMETAVNTDEPGPVLATIVSGKFSGSRLIGQIKFEKPFGEKVTIQFNQMSIPKRTSSVSVNIVAIDPETARTALASSVNHHYLLRYGMLFASSFVQGYGQAVQQQGSTSTTSPLTGAVTTSYPPLNNRQIFLSALGQLGTQWSNATKPLFNTPYTVRVDQGTGMGLLFLTDTDVSEEAN